MKKKLIVMLTSIIVFVLIIPSSLAACGGDDYIFQEGDFILTFEASKTEVRIGDTVELSVRLENMSGRDVLARVGRTGSIAMGMVPYPQDLSFVSVGRSCSNIVISLDLWFRPNRHAFIIERDSVIIESSSMYIYEWTIWHGENYSVNRFVVFFDVGRNFNERVVVYSEPIRINLIREND
ncbi:MAG: hypothetical protein FWE03_06335 [Firmicutes bacterium]|nr:hypothetical protein [Bacillota bacterium]